MTPRIWPAQPTPPPDGGGDSSGEDTSGGGPLGWLGDQASAIAQSALDDAAQTIWDAGIFVLHGGFTLADDASSIAPSAITGDPGDDPATPAAEAAGAVDVSSMWGAMVWLAVLIALGLFFFQLTSVALRGGRGMLRAVTGPAQFGIALAVTTGAVGILLTAADGLTELFLSSLSDQASFAGIAENPAVADRIGENPNLGDSIEDSVRSMLLALVALFGIIPAGIGFALQMIFRAAAIMVLIATVPITAACLITDTTSSIFWRTVRWILAAVLMKPALALVVLIGVHLLARSEGVAGLLAGAAVLLISLFCPFVLYRLLAFVDPGTGAGMAIRSGGGSRGSSEPGSDNGTSEAMNIARQSEQAYQLGSGQSSSAAGGGGELGGSTATPAARGAGAGGAGAGGAGAGAAGAGGGSSAAGAGAVGAAGGAAAAAVVGGYLATKAAGQAAGGFASEQMAQTGVGNPGPAPAAGASAGQISSSAGAAAGTVQNWGRSESGSGESESPPPGGDGPDAPPVGSGPPEAGPPDSGPTTPGADGQEPPRPDQAPPVAAGPDGVDPPTAAPGPNAQPPPDPGPPTRPAHSGEES